jgi:hypothetical protein
MVQIKQSSNAHFTETYRTTTVASGPVVIILRVVWAGQPGNGSLMHARDITSRSFLSSTLPLTRQVSGTLLNPLPTNAAYM